MRDRKPCEMCGVEVPFMAQVIEKSTGQVLWVCAKCQQRADMTSADPCDMCGEWKPREGGEAAEEESAHVEQVEVFWACAECVAG